MSTVESPIKWIMISRHRGTVCGFKGDSASRPVLVELEFQEPAPSRRELAAAQAAGRGGGLAGSLGGSTALEPGGGRNSSGLVGRESLVLERFFLETASRHRTRPD